MNRVNINLGWLWFLTTLNTFTLLATTLKVWLF